MEQINQMESGFSLQNLILVESNFKRESKVTFNSEKSQNIVNVDVSVQIENNIIIVTETLNFVQKFEEVTEVEALIRMIGIFEKFGESPLDLDKFGRVNGAAIIFPYIREQITNLAAKAGLGLILLPPFNFTANKVEK